MAAQRIVSIICAALPFATACGAHDTGPVGTGGAAGQGAGGTTGVTSASGGNAGGSSEAGASGAGTVEDCAHIDYASYASAPAVSFRNDVLPIFGLSCTLSDCHRPTDHRAGLVLGYRCTPDKTAKWSCQFPTTPTTDGDDTMSQPDDAATIAMVRTSLLSPATTVNGGAVLRVAPMHPESSFIMQKLAGTQNTQGYTCTNQDPSHPATTMVLPCGDSMPLGGGKWCEGTDRVRFDAIAAWIAQGALDD